MKPDKSGSNDIATRDEWYESKVKSSIAAVERGEITPDDEVRVWLEKRARSDAQRGLRGNRVTEPRL